MIFVGIKKDKDRANIIKYLQSLEQINYINTMFIINKYILINIKNSNKHIIANKYS